MHNNVYQKNKKKKKKRRKCQIITEAYNTLAAYIHLYSKYMYNYTALYTNIRTYTQLYNIM